mgnify:CR=1 FL=1
MTGDDDEVRREALAPFARDAVAALDARGAAVRPDFAAMLARARALAAEETSPAPVIPLVGEVKDGDAREAGLAAFTGALRAELDAKVEARSLAGIPPLRRTASRGRVRGAVLGVLAAAAAVLLIAFAGFGLARRGEEVGRGVEANAAQVGEVRDEQARGVAVPGRGEAVPVEAVPVEAVPVEEVVEGPVEAASAGPGAGEIPVRVDVEVPRRRPTKAAPRQVPAGPSLEEEAQALWQAGELAAAERKFREILRVADGRRAELAYGDLFALTRQMRGSDGQAGVWREYLGRFPGGRFAEDARAGLCQRMSGEARAACWREYLERHPDGAHRAQAEAGR